MASNIEVSDKVTSTEDISKGPWTKEEDELLKRLVLENDVALCKLNSAQNTRTKNYTRMHENS